MRARLRLLALLAAAAGVAACGYSTRFGVAERYPTVGIELFGNSSPERDLERELHESLVRSARDLLDARLSPPERAALVLRGEVTDYHRRGGIRSRDNVQLESGLTIAARGELYDPRTDQVVAGPSTARTEVGYTLDRRFANEAEARARALDHLAQRLVLDLASHLDPAASVQESGTKAR